MRKHNNHILFSASDLSNHLQCKYLSHLNLEVAKGNLEKVFTQDRTLELLRQRGLEFEKQFLQNLENQGYRIYKINTDVENPGELTLEAMKEGYDFIYQAYFNNEIWHGWADFLIKVEKPSLLGNWSYEIIDTKLSTNTRSGAILQIALYSEILAEKQGLLPEYMHIKNPEEKISFRVNDYIAYLRLIKERLHEDIKQNNIPYPEPCNHCDICNWWDHCNQKRREDDHLSFVAGMGNSQIKEFKNNNITTLKELSQLPLPIPFKPSKGSKESFSKLREQARLQYQAKNTGIPTYEVISPKENTGLFCLPEPSEGDILLKIEGNPLIEPIGMEYFFGWIFQGEFHKIWVTNLEEEKQAFISLVEFIISKKDNYPNLHVYHFLPYENAALKRLMSKYAVKENEIDQFLRNNTLVDLHKITKQSLRAGVEKYTLRELEIFYQYERFSNLREVFKNKSDLEFLLQSKQPFYITEEILSTLEKHFEEDCYSSKKLQQWLERERLIQIDNGIEIGRPERKEEQQPESVAAHVERITPIINALMSNVSISFEERDNVQQAHYLLANLLDWYRREEKSFWWEYFRILELEPTELLDEKTVLTGLRYTGERTPIARSVIDTYQFPTQENELKAGTTIKDGNGENVGELYEIDEKKQILKLKKGPSVKDKHPETIIKFEKFITKEKVENIIRFAEWVVENGITSTDPEYRVTRDILLNNPPRISKEISQTDNIVEKAKEWALLLDNSYLPIQGPPGAGKSYTASHIIFNLLKNGKRIGITALSHKVISSLLEKVKELADEYNYPLTALYKDSGKDEKNHFWYSAKTKEDFVANIQNYPIAAGTSFIWCNQDLKESLDYLFIDEAGQFALIETLVASHVAKNIVFLGDHQQLKQPIKGVHPEGTDVSALEHLLEGEKTIPQEKGIFLATTWRMHPDICKFDSEMFYESRLQPMDHLKNQILEGNTPFAGSGLYYKPIHHEGNTNMSLEEVDFIKNLVKDLTKGDVFWKDKEGKQHTLLPSHIKIITPYNSNVYEMQKAIPNIEVGTVDKFQGQEAPVILYSMASSSAQEAPRGMEFLYSPNRFNVAVSRARIAFILVGNPRLFEPDCQSPEQMKLANPFCRYMEMAKVIA